MKKKIIYTIRNTKYILLRRVIPADNRIEEHYEELIKRYGIILLDIEYIKITLFSYTTRVYLLVPVRNLRDFIRDEWRKFRL